MPKLFEENFYETQVVALYLGFDNFALFYFCSWKRNSHVVNLTEEANEKTEKSKTSSQSSPTYCDEDGQPCSDV